MNNQSQDLATETQVKHCTAAWKQDEHKRMDAGAAPDLHLG